MKIIYYLILIVLISSCDAVIIERGETEAKIKKSLEEAYFEGQKDAILGDVRIVKNNDSCWMWTKSCWDSGEEPTYNPSIVCEGGNKTESEDIN